jgi:uncharacterized protein YcfL
MKCIFSIIAVLMLAGCDNTSEQAPGNLKKGDQYFEAKEYEVAEYYYEKIPQDSPQFKEAQAKLQKIAEIQKSKLPTISAADESRKVSVFDQSITSNALGKMPIHSVSLNNESSYKLASVEFEFTYYDAGGNLIAAKRCRVKTPIPAKSQETFSGISPGVLEETFTSSKVRILSADFQ